MEDHRSGHPSVGPLADILNGLEELHRLDYRHRDLKPQNILFYNGMWRLADFGLALPPADATTTLTRTHEIFGTEKYMSPEQATAFHTVLPATDIYAFGCILHDLVGVSPSLYFPRLTSLSCRQGKQPLGDGPNFLLGDPGRTTRESPRPTIHAPSPTLVCVAWATVRIVPWRCSAVHQVVLLPTPCPTSVS